MSKVKFFSCHKFGHCARKCLHRKKGENEMQPYVVVLAKAQMDDFSNNFEQTDFLLVS
jgi:hypothetical protein